MFYHVVCFLALEHLNGLLIGVEYGGAEGLEPPPEILQGELSPCGNFIDLT